MVLRHFSATGNKGRITQQTWFNFCMLLSLLYVPRCHTRLPTAPCLCRARSCCSTLCIKRMMFHCLQRGHRTPYTWSKLQLTWAQIRKHSTCTWHCLKHCTLFLCTDTAPTPRTSLLLVLLTHHHRACLKGSDVCFFLISSEGSSPSCASLQHLPQYHLSWIHNLMIGSNSNK